VLSFERGEKRGEGDRRERERVMDASSSLWSSLYSGIALSLL
jgi:hypothetical protein